MEGAPSPPTRLLTAASTNFFPALLRLVKSLGGRLKGPFPLEPTREAASASSTLDGGAKID